MICEKCGTRNQNDAFYCENCGKAIETKEEKIKKRQCQICHRGHDVGAKYCATYGYNIEKWKEEKNKFEREKSAAAGIRIKEGILFSLLLAWVIIATFSFLVNLSLTQTTLLGAANIAFSIFCVFKTETYLDKRDNYWDEIWQKRADKLKA